MCIIAYKPYGISMPTEKTIKNCFNANPDGAGILLRREKSKKMEIYKGFFDVKEFILFIQSLKISENDMAVLHFRITTSGGTKAENCHPFPISNKVKDLQSLNIKTDKAFIHNGVLGKGEGNLSDTMLYVRDKLFTYRDSLGKKKTQEKIRTETQGSRTITIDTQTETILLTGEWIEDNGIYYSNSSFKDIDTRWSRYFEQYTDNEIEICPVCGEIADCISYNNGLFECPNCLCVYNEYKDILIDGFNQEGDIDYCFNDKETKNISKYY